MISPKRSRYAGAAVTAQGDKIVTVETDVSYQTNVVVLDARGRVIKKLPNPENDFYAMPRLSEDGKKIAVLKTVPAGKTISLIDL
jgi:Tol biopolymer transport system component